MTPAQQFFDALYAGQNGVLELRTFGPDISDKSEKAEQLRRAAKPLCDFVPVKDGVIDMGRVDRYLKGCRDAKLNAYYGVALRTQTAIKDEKGDTAHCQVLTAVFVDADFKYFQGDETETRRCLAEHSPPPSMMVHSGGGLHPYWLLEQPLLLQTAEGLAKAKSVLRRLAMSVSKTVDEQVSHPIAILRIPGSLNFKYDPPRLVTLEGV